MEDLRSELHAGRLVIVAGAGVSTAAADLPGWLGILRSAIAHLRTVGTADEADIIEAEDALQRAHSPGDLVECANKVKALLVGPSGHSGEFAAWLKQTFGVPAEAFRGAPILSAIHGIGPKLLTTTNYEDAVFIGTWARLCNQTGASSAG